MAALTIEVGPEVLQGLQAVADVEAARAKQDSDLAETAAALLHETVQARLGELGLHWAPSPEAVARRVEEAKRPESRLHALLTSHRVRAYGASALLVAVLVVLWGGYVDGWQWTGFRGNEQLWDWLHLLVLPVVVGTIPLWLQHSDYISNRRRLSYAAIAVALAGFVAAGYLVPLTWTGFSGNTLWDWLGLLLLPIAVSSARFLPRVIRSLRPAHRAGGTAIAVTWIVTIIGGYGWRWTWTGYQGNTLWDWLGLLLLPVLVPIFLLPAALRWISDNAPLSGQVAAPPSARAGAGRTRSARATAK